MKILLYILITFSLFCSQSIFSQENPNKENFKKIILHFDVNKTILADDPAGGKTLRDVLIHSLADKYKDRWDENVLEPISYSDYVKNYLLPGENTNSELKALRNQKISEFLIFLKEKNHPQKDLIEDQFNKMSEKISKDKSIIFKSFYNLISYFKNENVDFSIILRTFGNDLDRVTHEIDQITSSKFFSFNGKFKEGKLFIETAPGKEACITKISEVYQFFKHHGNLAIQDSWIEWNQHKEHQEFGKRFPIDLEDTNTLSVFFDDNIIDDPNSLSNIVNPINVNTDRPISVSNLVKNKNIVVVDTIQAILDDEYYVNKVKDALEIQAKSQPSLIKNSAA